MGFKAFMSIFREVNSSNHLSRDTPSSTSDLGGDSISFRTCRSSSNTSLDRVSHLTGNPGDGEDSQSVQQTESDVNLSQESPIPSNLSSFPSEIKAKQASMQVQSSITVPMDILSLPRNPNRHDPDHNRDRLDQLFHKLIPRLDRVSEDRFEARSQRYELKNKREELLDTGIELMQRLNDVFSETDPCIIKPLAGLFEKYQTEQDTYLALEDDYRELENELIVQEYKLEKVQSKLSRAFHRTKHPSIEGGTSTDTDDSDDDSSSSKVSDCLIETEAYDPLKAQYLSLLGKHSLLSEELFNLRSRRHALLNEKVARGNFRPTLDDESEAFLEQFDVLEAELMEELDSLKQNAARVQECRDQGLSLPGNGDNSDPKDSSLEPSDELRINSLLEQKIRTLSLFSEENSTQAHRPFNIMDHINTWLLHQLRLSMFEMLRFKVITGFDIEEVDEQKFYECWFNDETAIQRMTPPISWGSCGFLEVSSGRSSRSESIPDDHSSPASAPSFNPDTEPPASRQQDSKITTISEFHDTSTN
ncbi:hypothetical protein AJ78_05069 [Emergomyces pasteurianus Ep9510]|uniref:Uncharacterized protein n=1 Tax=Emergomyces pasteurianus Ep9510 TaxID=1447872 RepID=A0A1J9PDL3_9EURO|nr:hypothetical protein AJ78_05069 [Emergomyces pasteurianus Ep9510]